MKQLTLKRFIHISEQGQEPKEAPSMEIDINVKFDDEEYIVDSVDIKVFGEQWQRNNVAFQTIFEVPIDHIINEIDLEEEFKNQ